MNEKQMMKGLNSWFLVHCVIDILFAIPLMLFPHWFLTLLGWQTTDPVTARLVAAALFAIGIESGIARGSTPEQYQPMLNLKIIWSAAAVVGFIWSLIDGAQGRPFMLWVVMLIFVAFNFIWIYYRMQLTRFLARE